MERNIAIRRFAREDYTAVFDLWRRTPGMGMRSLDDSEEGIARYLARNPNTCFVAERDGVLVGAILAGHDGRRGYLYHTCVDADHRGRGLGKALVERAVAALGGEGIHKAALVCFCANGTGNAFWQGMGWTKREDLNYFDRPINPENR